jgi:hypothetical protein
MAEDAVTENEKEDDLLSAEERQLLDSTEVREEDAAQFPQELIAESTEELTSKQRENIYQMILKMSVPQKIRLAMLGNREARKVLIHDRNRVISTAVLRSPKITESEILFFAQERNTPQEVILTICKRRTWLKKYQIKLALVGNPKTPLTRAVQFLSHLHDKDLQALYHNKNIPSVLSQTAWQVLRKRRP